MKTAPKGWTAGKIEHREQRLTNVAAIPLTYNADTRTVDAVLSKGASVTRPYGCEVLQIDARSVNLDRVRSGGIPLLDSHNQSGISNSLGKVTNAWFSGGALMGKISFHATSEGRKAEGMVKRGEIGAVSIGYRVTAWRAEDSEGNSVDSDAARWDDDLTFTATKWELLEASLVCVPADSSASVRSLGNRNSIGDVRARMDARQRMQTRQRMVDAQGRK